MFQYDIQHWFFSIFLLTIFVWEDFSATKIEHAAWYAKDLSKAKDFFETYFNGKSNELYQNPKTGFSSYFIQFDEGARLEIMHNEAVEKDENKPVKNGCHPITFAVGSKEKADALNARLQKDGFEVVSGPRTTKDGYYESCVLGFENNLIEITE